MKKAAAKKKVAKVMREFKAGTLHSGKDPKGGLTAAGRAYFKRTEGSNLKAPVKGGLNPRRISFAARFGGMAGAMKDSKNSQEARKVINYTQETKKWAINNVKLLKEYQSS